MSRKEQIEKDKRTWGNPYIYPDCDDDIAAGIVECINHFKMTDSIGAENFGYSINERVRKHFNPIFSEYIKRTKLIPPTWEGFSELFCYSQGKADFELEEWGKRNMQRLSCAQAFLKFHVTEEERAEAEKQLDWEWKRHNSVQDTNSALRDFLALCYQYELSTKEVLVQNRSDNKLTLKKIKRVRSQTKNIQNLPYQLTKYGHWKGYCKLCGNNTELNEYQEKCIAEGKVEDDSLDLKVRSLSPNYCARHNPVIALYNKDNGKRKYFYFLLALIYRARIADHKSVNTDSARYHAYLIVMQTTRISKILKRSCDQFLSTSLESPCLEYVWPKNKLMPILRMIIDEASKYGYPFSSDNSPLIL